MPKQQPWTSERAGALLSDVRPDSEPKYCVRAVFRRRTRTEQTPAEGLLRALWEATDREAVSTTPGQPPTVKRPRIILDDDPGRIEYLENELFRAGFRTVTKAIGSGIEAIAGLAAH